MNPIIAFLLLTATFTVLVAEPIVSFSSRFHPISTADRQGMVVAQEILAAEAGAKILAAGGNAIDAAVATGFALAVTYPQAGNIGGGGFMVAYLPSIEPSPTNKQATKMLALDFREKAPAAASKDMFLNEKGDQDNYLARYSMLSTAIPGTVKGLVHAQNKYGKLTLKQVMQPAIQLASEGFRISPTQEMSFIRVSKHLLKHASSSRYFYQKDKSPLRRGQLLKQTDLASTLKRIAQTNGEDFYQGKTAKLLVNYLEKHGGIITAEDLKSYHIVERTPLKGNYRGHQIITMPPPSSGGIHFIQMMNMLSAWDIASLGHNSAQYLHRLSEVMKRAYADRSAYLGDSDFYPVPIQQLIDPSYAQHLTASINLSEASPPGSVNPGLLGYKNYVPLKKESPQTTHYNVYDKFGNVVSVTYTLNFSYGNGAAVAGAGFLLNNQMDDFVAKPNTPNGYGLVGSEANAIEKNKRPLSSMTPVIILKNNKPVLALGAPGGSRIITSVLQTALNVIDFDMNIAEAILAPRIHHQWRPQKLFVEKGLSTDTLEILKQKGHSIKQASWTLGKVQGIQWKDGFLYGRSDPRWPGGGVSIESNGLKTP